ncbi:hypothetical protein BLA60_18860 [Actinophytocola xinjiangensis]|uniref:Condensation domain-containing protein n=1 Tax=Actinophytocola xinjiangensis TaxID=485602 RepID=A0A7Z0WM45_9PSEU|nr:condensation domain-containing protein [Actinophytocola xinjiangensis]OLF09828.1 hypothetical protein BLA60_18860 [Actinophytocola xinjiangensis]
MAATSSPGAGLLGRLADLARGSVIPPRAPGARAPLSSAQERLWFLDQLEPGSPTYTMPEALRLAGDLDRAAFERAFHALVDRHEILRSVVGEQDGQPYQTATAAPVLTYEELPPEAVRSRLAADAARGFDLATGPLVSAHLIRVADRDHVLALNMHHIVSDGWSMDVLCADWAELYRAELSGAPPDLAPLPIQYADYAVWQRDWLTSAECAAQEAYWRSHLAGAPLVHALPTAPRPDALGGPAGTVEFPVPGGGVPVEGVTPTMVYLAAFQLVLAEVGGVDDVVVGLPTAGRSRPETEPLVGFFVNSLAVRTDLSGRPTLRAAVGRVREVCLAAYDNQDVPFERLVEVLRPPRSLGSLPLFQIMFSYEPPGDTPSWPGLTVRRLPQESGASKFDLGLSVTGNRGVFSYRTDLIDPALAATLSTRFQDLLRADPDLRRR